MNMAAVDIKRNKNKEEESGSLLKFVDGPSVEII
jgi:hypothetical protein